jgi:hypothetical protein
MHEAYQPVIDDGRGRFPEDLRVKAPRAAKAAIAAAADLKNTSHSEYVRQALLRSLEADGVRLRRGMVEVGGDPRIAHELEGIDPSERSNDEQNPS